MALLVAHLRDYFHGGLLLLCSFSFYSAIVFNGWLSMASHS